MILIENSFKIYNFSNLFTYNFIFNEDNKQANR